MNIPEEVQIKWTSLKQKGDITDIATESGFSTVTITQAMKDGECSMEVFEAIQTFYNKRQQAIDHLVNPHREVN